MAAYSRVYRMLRSAGHSPGGALKVVVDASRKNDSKIRQHAREWIGTVFKLRRRVPEKSS